MRASGDLLETSLDLPETIINEERSQTDDVPSVGRHISLRSIDAVAAHIPFIESARSKVTTEMESMVLEGLAQVASYLSSALETSAR
jgi:conserved oligomeric Golgi complex subunit 5